MSVMSSRRLARATVPAAAVLALTAVLAGCRTGQVAVSPASGSPAAAASNAAETSAADPASTAGTATAGGTAAVPTTTPAGQSEGTGSLSVSVSSPVTLSGSVSNRI